MATTPATVALSLGLALAAAMAAPQIVPVALQDRRKSLTARSHQVFQRWLTGAYIGGAILGIPGAIIGAALGNFFGVGLSGSFVPSTGSVYLGPTAVVGLGGGTGGSLSFVNVPSTQNPNSIANGPSFSLTYQPLLFAGSTIIKSPGSGPPVVGPSLGTRIPSPVESR